MSEMISFDLGDALSVVHRRVLSPENRQGVEALLKHMTGEDVFSHNLKRALDWASPKLIEICPDLRGVEVPEKFDSLTDFDTWLVEQKERLDLTVPVPSFSDSWEKQKPLVELSELKRGGNEQ